MNPRTHRQQFETTITVSRSDLGQGDLITFMYKSSTKNKNIDKRPFILFLGLDKEKHLVHGLSLNYLTKRQISALFKSLNSSLFEGARLFEESDIDEESGIKDVALSRVSVGDARNQGLQQAIGERIYERIARPFMKRVNKNIYRSYKWTNITNLRLVRYKWDVAQVNRLQ